MSSPSLASPLLGGRSLPVQAGAVLAGTVFLALASWIQVPMIPVPMTMQTFAVPVIGALFGWRLGTLTVLAWLAEALVGLPVLAGFKSGFAPFVGPTAGYLVAFPIAALMVGVLVQRGWTTPVRAGLAMLAANVLILAVGGAWLAALIGVEKGLALGVTPFLLGGALKAALGAAVVVATPGLHGRG